MSEKIERALAVLITLALAAPAAAMAQEHEAAANNPFAGDFGNALWTVIIFVLVLVVLGKFAWGPILKGLQARESYILESLEKAKKERDEADARMKLYEDKLAQARTEVTAMVEEGRRDAEVVKRKILEEARQEAEKERERTKREIQLATDTATKQLYALSARIATDLAGRIIRKELTPQDHERLIAESIQELSSAAPQA
ncbi:MAG TPA: F0F1 ATP synthase subunit B [Thermoanaerobaculia bacterium]|jgi:F-type H+-transporting ATPase subunit b|nr:F0F1 ATP synthase subunit B [Thermoanaerobaculia bacterium]